jgi:hypothetical protein
MCFQMIVKWSSIFAARLIQALQHLKPGMIAGVAGIGWSQRAISTQMIEKSLAIRARGEIALVS